MGTGIQRCFLFAIVLHTSSFILRLFVYFGYFFVIIMQLFSLLFYHVNVFEKHNRLMQYQQLILYWFSSSSLLLTIWPSSNLVDWKYIGLGMCILFVIMTIFISFYFLRLHYMFWMFCFQNSTKSIDWSSLIKYCSFYKVCRLCFLRYEEFCSILRGSWETLEELILLFDPRWEDRMYSNENLIFVYVGAHY